MRVVRHGILPETAGRLVSDEQPCVLAVTDNVERQSRVCTVRNHYTRAHIALNNVVLQGTQRVLLQFFFEGLEI